MTAESNVTVPIPSTLQGPFLFIPPFNDIPAFDENELIQWKQNHPLPSHASLISSVSECRLWSLSMVSSLLIPACDYYQFTITPVSWSDMQPMSSLHSRYESLYSFLLIIRKLQQHGMYYYTLEKQKPISPALGSFYDPSLLLLLPTRDFYSEDVEFSIEPLRMIFLRNHTVVNVYKKPIFGMSLSVSKFPRNIQSKDVLSLKTLSSKVWIDEVGIFFSRGYSNIYHNMETMNCILHWATNIKSVSRLRWIVIVRPTSSQPAWPDIYLQAVLKTIPEEYRPILIPYQRLQKIQPLYIRHVVSIGLGCYSLDSLPHQYSHGSNLHESR